jgi:hypothetical protein
VLVGCFDCAGQYQGLRSAAYPFFRGFYEDGVYFKNPNRAL